MDALPANILTDEPAEVLSDVRRELSGSASRASCEALLRSAGLKPTRQRIMLGDLLFSGGHRHVTAEQLYGEILEANMHLSLATVYNTLNQFTEAGLLRRIGADGNKSFFDTNTSVHPHFYIEDEDILIDIPEGLVFQHVPAALPGYELSRLDVIVHLRRKPGG
ncbi:MAG: transcriptional repressor [Bradyrhizobium sp.]|uniref:Fur family transcriptional regulator Irr n=1 Tax=Bradyrhizobium sp. TaxID=376 RepID=UPI0025C72900|nr:Fur family transcriptional regulator [Bradyrhizobium sp.]MBI5264228.1 transcriptional repressor [Bradyrhizobium sp.]